MHRVERNSGRGGAESSDVDAEASESGLPARLRNRYGDASASADGEQGRSLTPSPPAARDGRPTLAERRAASSPVKGLERPPAL